MDINMSYYEAIKNKLIEKEYSFIEDEGENSKIFVITMTMGILPGMKVFLTYHDKSIIDMRCYLALGDIEKEETQKQLIEKLNQLNFENRFVKFVVDDEDCVYGECSFMLYGTPEDAANHTTLMLYLLKVICSENIPEILNIFWDNE